MCVSSQYACGRSTLMALTSPLLQIAAIMQQRFLGKHTPNCMRCGPTPPSPLPFTAPKGEGWHGRRRGGGGGVCAGVCSSGWRLEDAAAAASQSLAAAAAFAAGPLLHFILILVSFFLFCCSNTLLKRA